MSRSKIFAITPLDDKCQNLQTFHIYFCASSYRFRDFKIFLYLTFKKVGQGHREQFSQLHHSMANVNFTK